MNSDTNTNNKASMKMCVLCRMHQRYKSCKYSYSLIEQKGKKNVLMMPTLLTWTNWTELNWNWWLKDNDSIHFRKTLRLLTEKWCWYVDTEEGDTSLNRVDTNLFMKLCSYLWRSVMILTSMFIQDILKPSGWKHQNVVLPLNSS